MARRGPLTDFQNRSRYPTAQSFDPTHCSGRAGVHSLGPGLLRRRIPSLTIEQTTTERPFERHAGPETNAARIGALQPPAIRRGRPLA